MPEDIRLNRINGIFYAVWNDELGKRHRKSLRTSSPAEARGALREYQESERERKSPRERLTVDEIWAAYVADRKAEGKVSVTRMEDAWKRLAPHFGGMRGVDIGGDLVRAYTAKRRKHGASDGTIHTELGYLRAALRRAIKGNTPHIQLPSKPRPRSRHLTPDEARRLIDAAKVPHVRLFISLALYTAGRPSSILDLTWDRVDFGKRRLALDNPSRDRTNKGRATVPIGDPAIDILRRGKEAAITSHVIEWAGKPVQSVKKAIQRAAERAGLEGVTPYVLRHTAAVWMAEAGVPIAEIGQFLGHNNVSTTYRVYARYSPEYLKRASDAISTALHVVDRPEDKDK